MSERVIDFLSHWGVAITAGVILFLVVAALWVHASRKGRRRNEIEIEKKDPREGE